MLAGCGQASVTPRRRVFLYITRPGRLLVLRHVDFPELLPEVPGGTVERGELPAIAASREAYEETGLSNLEVPCLLGSQLICTPHASRPRPLDAWFYQIRAAEEVPERWQHVERFPHGGTREIRFDLSWLALADAPKMLSEDDLLAFDKIVDTGNESN